MVSISANDEGNSTKIHFSCPQLPYRFGKEYISKQCRHIFRVTSTCSKKDRSYEYAKMAYFACHYSYSTHREQTWVCAYIIKISYKISILKITIPSRLSQSRQILVRRQQNGPEIGDPLALRRGDPGEMSRREGDSRHDLQRRLSLRKILPGRRYKKHQL